jgi:hypothetical protein
VQSGHAVIEAARAGLIPDGIEHPHLIILEVPHEGKLHAACEYLTRHGVRHARWSEPDLGDELTAIATEAVYGECRKLFSRFSLLRSPQPVEVTS